MADTPSIRFDGFTDDWEQRKLSECAGFRRGSFPQPYGNKEWYDGEEAMPFVQVADVADDMKLVDDTKQKISKLAQPMSVFADKGSVLVTLQGSIGRVAITQYGAFVDRTVLIFDRYNQDIDKTFWAYIIKEKFIDEARKAPGGTIKTITKEALSDFDLMLPCFDEQKKLGEFLVSIDNLITLHQRKCNILTKTKKYMLQKMFPKNGKKIPEIRFEGFTDDWEQRKLVDLTDRIIVGLATSVTPYYRESGVPLLRNMNIKENYLDDSDILYLDEDYAKNNESKMIHANDVLTVHTGANIGLTCLAPKEYDGCLSFTTLITTPKNSVLDSLFLMQYMNSEYGKKGISSIITAGGKPNLNSGDLEKLDVLYPRIDEQIRIGEFFVNLDNLITLHQRKYDTLKTIKKYMLKQMFI